MPTVTGGLNRRGFARRKLSRSAADAIDAMLLDATTAMAGAWLIVIALSIPTPEAGLRQPIAGWLVLGATGAAWSFCLLLHWAPRWVFIAVAAIGLIVLAAFTAPEYWSGASPVMATWAKLFALCSAPLLKERQAILVIVGVGLALIATVSLVGVSEAVSSTLAWRGGLFAAIASIAFGMAAVGVVGALRRVARESDEAAAEAQDASAVAAHDQARRDGVGRFAAVIHDGLVNTLGAVARGSAKRNRSLTIERCRADATAMRSFLSAERRPGPGRSQPRAGAATEIVDLARRRARLLGLDLVVAVETDTTAIPLHVVDAASSVVDEALINVSKHAGVHRAALTIERGVDWLRIEILDEGNGFDLVATGQPEGIADRCRRLGIGLAVETSPGSGTSVRLEWKAPAPGGPAVTVPATRSMSMMERARRRMVRWMCGWLLGLFVAQTIASWGLAPLAGNLLALALMVPACLIAVRWADAGRRLPPAAGAYLVFAAGLVTYISTAGAIGCARLEIAWWGATGGTLCLILLMLLSSGGWFLAGAASYLIGAAAVSWDLGMQAAAQSASTCGPWTVPPLLLEAAVILAVIYLMQPLTASHARTAAKWRVEASRIRQRTAQQTAREEIRRLHDDRALSPALTLLDSIANGTADPADSAVQAQCASEERYLRSLIALDSDLLELGDVLAEAIRFGRQREVEVSIDSGEPVDLPSLVELNAIEVTLRTILERFEPGSVIRLVLFPEASGGRLTIMSARRPPPLCQADLAAISSTQPGSLTISDQSDEDEFLVELDWGS